MEKVNKLFLVLLSFSFVFIVTNYFILSFIVDRDYQISISYSIEKEETVYLTYNRLPKQAGVVAEEKVLLAGGDKVLQLDLPYELEVQYIYLYAENPVSFNLHSISVSSPIKEHNFSVESLNKVLNEKHIGTLEDTQLKIVDNRLIVDLAESNEVLQFKPAFCNTIYQTSEERSYFIAAIIALIISLLLTFIVPVTSTIQPSKEVLFFLVSIILLFIPFFSPKEYKSEENRALAPFPDLKVNIWKIPVGFQTFFNDHFPFRNELKYLNSQLKINVFNQSPIPDRVQIGKDGWLFQSNKAYKDVYQGVKIFSDQELHQIKDKLEKKASLLSQRGIEFYFFIPPIKHSIYPEYLPERMKKVGYTTKREQLLTFLKKESDIHVIDPLNVLMKQKNAGVRMYYKTDSHWNQLGGFYSYQLIIEEINKTYDIGHPKQIDDYEIKKYQTKTGDLLQMLNVYNRFDREYIDMIPAYETLTKSPQSSVPFGSETEFFYYESKKKQDNRPRLLTYRDSYSSYLHPHLKEHFSYSGFAWDFRLNPDRISESKPDIILFEISEALIDKLLEN